MSYNREKIAAWLGRDDAELEAMAMQALEQAENYGWREALKLVLAKLEEEEEEDGTETDKP